MTAEAVTLAVDKPLRGSMLSSEVRWRMDKDEVSSIFTRMRCNILGQSCFNACFVLVRPFNHELAPVFAKGPMTWKMSAAFAAC